MIGIVVVLVLLGSIAGYVLLTMRYRRDVDRLYDVPDDMKRADSEPQRPYNPGPNTWFPKS